MAIYPNIDEVIVINVDIQMNARRQEYSTYTPIDIVIVSYNLDSRKPIDMDTGDQVDRSFLQEFISNNNADIYVFGFQELIDLENVIVINGRKVRMPRHF